jgi:hypothetical protein
MLCSMTKAIMRRSVLFAGMFGGAAALGWAGAGLQAQSGATTAIDFRVVGPDGQPVRDLKAEEVTLRIAGRPRAIKSLELVEAGGGGGAASSNVPPPFGTNTGASGASGERIVIIVVEDETLPPGAEVPLRQALGEYLDKLSPSDRVAFAISPRDTAGVGFGAGIPKIKEALGSLSGRRRGVSANERACRARDTILLLRNMLSQFAGIETPVTMLFFSTQMTSPSGTSSGGSCDLTTEHYQNLGTTGAAARAQFYVINSDNAVSQRDDGLETLASVTGAGTVLRMAGNPDLLQRIAAETSAYYKAIVDAESSDRAGQGQRLDLRVAREGVTTRFRPEVVATASAAAATKPGAKVAPGDMLRDTGAFTDLPVRTVGVPSRDVEGRIKVAVFSEPVDPATKLTAAAVGLIGADGKFAPAVIDQKQMGSYPIVTAHSVAPGTYRLRFAAVDASGKAGAADYQVNATLTDAGPLKMSGLMVTGIRNNNIAPQMLFSDEPAALAYMEIYGELNAPVSARIEVASSLDGPAIEEVEAGGQQTNEADKFVLTGQIPLAKLQPGDYVVRAIVKMGENPEGKVIASFRKVQK